MNFRGGCCIARCGGGGGTYDMSKADRIMLRFRPIAPRPVIGGSSSPPEKSGLSSSVSSKSGRGRRKIAKESSNSSGSMSSNRNGNGKRCNKRRREEPKDGGGVMAEVVTLPLLPETPERKDLQAPPPPPVTASVLNSQRSAKPFWLSFSDGGRSDGQFQTATKMLMPSDLTETVTSCVTVECITDTWVEGQYFELGCTDEEMKMNLEKDTCPSFISDVMGRVTWTNGPYRDLVVGNRSANAKITVWLVMKERPMLLTQPAFTCRVRLEYTCRNKEKSSMITLPCDVWRMSDGGFAWRLDVDAALCLGR
ncbi:PREDICTED: uncharacterized protein LOC104811601 [Tarenaya hassleriana]|uniref:uncharacterized protein LOC104811601 n=1 Tax=Tarenaya hassleriana TaxID=28532 RepID=UPI00053C9A81|nr:PREDICTED: uncharacterized protein LOC104811601 [Tarenaya hassleriana]